MIYLKNGFKVSKNTTKMIKFYYILIYLKDLQALAVKNKDRYFAFFKKKMTVIKNTFKMVTSVSHLNVN